MGLVNNQDMVKLMMRKFEELAHLGVKIKECVAKLQGQLGSSYKLAEQISKEIARKLKNDKVEDQIHEGF